MFQFLDSNIIPDHMIIAITLDDAYHLGVLSSRIHVVWTLEQGGTLEDRPRYSKSRCFDPFPFPDPADAALKADIRAAAEELDATRKRVLAEHPDLTLTKLYNVLERMKALAVPSPSPLAGEGGPRVSEGRERGRPRTRSVSLPPHPPRTHVRGTFSR